MRNRFFRSFALPLLVVASCVLPAFGGDSEVTKAGIQKDVPFKLVAKDGKQAFLVDGKEVAYQAVVHVKDDGSTVLVLEYLPAGSGWINDTAKIVYDLKRQDGPDPDPTPNPDPTPDPEPDPVPPPDQKYMVAFFGESNDLDNGTMTPDQMLFFTSLVWRAELEAKGHKFIGALDTNQCASGKCSVVPTALKPWYTAVAKAEKPCVAIAPIAGGPIKVYPLPATSEELYKLIGGK